MNKTELQKFVGSFGKIIGGAGDFKKSLFGHIHYVDIVGIVTFVDNDGYSHRFQPKEIDSFEPMEFKDKS